ncbi:MAG: NAD(P)H-hydrate dehydratase [Pseudomonadota bacterium]|nr:NAD(P)H-hydrate dehydratase [Pseudomonadota bacterium]
MLTGQPLYTIDAIRYLESAALDSGVEELDLMTHAGAAAFHTLQTKWPRAKHIMVFVGAGNNGGDGCVLAKMAQHAGLDVSIVTVGDMQNLPSTARWAYETCVHAEVPISVFSPDKPIVADVIVDALLGIGIHGEVRPPYRDAIDAINQTGKPVLAIDVPSGLHADTGTKLGSTIVANVTQTFIGLKQGFYTASGRECCGEIYLTELHIDKAFFKDVKPASELLIANDFCPCLPRRAKDTHKGDFGHVLVIGGDSGMPGAVRMAAEAAARVGAGLVSIATRIEHAACITASRPELMTHAVTKPKELLPLIANASVVVIGPGLGRQSWGEALWNSLYDCQLPMVVDADALHWLTQGAVKGARRNWIITPHPGEAASLLNTTSLAIQHDRFHAVRELQKHFGGVTVLKGSGTLIAGEDQSVSVSAAGNPGMASGGMGDVLSGVLGGLLAQGLSLIEAARLGVLLHGVAADRAAHEGGERGLLAMDVIKKLRGVLNDV